MLNSLANSQGMEQKSLQDAHTMLQVGGRAGAPGPAGRAAHMGACMDVLYI